MKSMIVLAAMLMTADTNNVTVTGTGSAKIAPDRVSFTVGVLTNAPSVNVAFETNNKKTRAVVDALKKRGVKDAEIQTSNFSIQTAYDDYQSRKRNGYNVTNSVTVTREDPKNVSELIQAAVDAGANEANGVSFFNADPNTARDRAIERAVADARRQADKLAAATGTTLGRVTMITTVQLPMGYMANQNTVSEAITVTEAPAIEAGMNTVRYSVTITYELK